jgi:hypothetical protein
VADTIVEITTFNESGNALSIKVTAEEVTPSQGTTQVNLLKVTLEADGNPVGIITFDPSNDSLQISGMSLSVVGYTSCLVACGLGHLVSDILGCRRRGHKTAKDLIACLKKKGHRLSLNLINCAVSCIAAAVVP